MPTLNFKFTLNHHQGFPPPSVVLAVDLNDNQQADAGENVLMTRAGLNWTGSLTFTTPASANGVVAMVAFHANPGATFKLTATDANDNAVADVSDIVASFPDVRFIVLGGP